jgi:selenocysteine-specific elongation factor
MAERKYKPEFAQALVGTAGHVDHGKTSLVKNLTGCDTDRLPEEKARGLSIDLGFAPCLLPSRRIVGIVDVPGHSDFIRNMVAGAASIDVLLLVVAADDGVMPQTEEHTTILKLLRTPQVMVALTKIDLVSPARVEEVRQDLADFMARMGFPDAPIVGVSNKTLEGLGELRQTLTALVERASQRSPDGRVFRMNVERIFSVKGLGTVVTGIPLSGTIHVSEKAELLPARLPTMIRAIQTFKFDTELAQAHVCAALSLRDVETGQAARGMTLAAPGFFAPVTSVLASLQNVSGTFCFKHATSVMLHTGTSVAQAVVKLLDLAALPPGRDGFALIKFEDPLVFAAGDQFIVRSLSPVMTVGGGRVLTTSARRMGKFTPEFAGWLRQATQAAQANDPLGSELHAGNRAVFRTSELLRLTQLPEAAALENLRAKEQTGELVPLGGSVWMVASKIQELQQVLEPAVAHYHRANKYAWGLSPAHVCKLLGVDAQCFPKLAERLCAGGTLALKHGRLALAAFQPSLSASQMKLREELLARITAAGVNAPARGNLMAELKISDTEMRLMTNLLVEEGLVKVLDKNLLSGAIYATCRQKLLGLFSQKPVVDIAAFREATGVNRKLATEILEAFDAEGLTKRVETGRVLIKKTGS